MAYPDERSLSYRSSSVISDGRTSTKRPRVSAACEHCRSRKLGCDGRRPCGRCSAESRECRFEDRPERTPLTRARMTELEERIEVYEKLFRGVVPNLSLDETYEEAKKNGIDAAIARVRGELQVPLHPLQLPSLPPPPTTTTIQAPPTSASLPPIVSPHRERENVYPPTRDVSPDTNIPSFNIPLEKEPSAYEWHERKGHQDVTDDAAQDGMGGGLGEQGVSYMGLSSSATFVHAIRRLSSQPIFSTSPSDPILNPSFDIAAFLGGLPQQNNSVRPSIRMPPLSEIRPYVEGYFTYFHSLTPLVHEPTIRAQVSGAIPLSSKPGANILLYMILAMGAFDLATSQDADDGDRYYQMAWMALQHDMLEQGTIELVQGLAIMANYLQRSNRPNAGYICLGIAIRMGLALGLHTPTMSSSILDREMRTRVWWALVTLEAGCSVTFGRPHALGATALKNIRLPINCDDEHLTVSTIEPPADVAYPTQYTALIIQSQLAKATCSIHDKILQSHPAPSIEQVQWSDERFVQVFNDIPAFMFSESGPYRLARSIQLWRARDFRAILYRPVLLAAAWDSSRRKMLNPVVQQAIATCRSLAQDNLKDISSYVSRYKDSSRGAEWYLLYFAFQSSLTLLLSVVWEPSHPDASTWRSTVLTTAGWFRQLHSMQKLGRSYAKVLENIVNSAPTPTASLTAAHNASSGSPAIATYSTEPMPNTLSLDVSRYWQEIWGNELAPVDLQSGGWEQIFNNLVNQN